MAKFKSERQKVHQRDELGSYQDVNGMKLCDLIALLTELQKKHGKDGQIGIEVDSDYGYNSGYTSVRLDVSSVRLETPLEYAERHKQWQAIEKAKRDQAKKNRQLREEHERKEFERLQKKFGKNK